jgi:hypothetical protein
MKPRAKLDSKSKHREPQKHKVLNDSAKPVAVPKKVAPQTERPRDEAAFAGDVKDPAMEGRALKLLRSQDFLNQVVSATRRMGLVGEENNKLVVFLVGTSRVLDKPLCLFVKGPSSAGKNYLTDTVFSLFPESEWRSLTSSSKRSWNYLGEQLENKIVYLKERNADVGPVDPLRLLISEKQLVHSVTVLQDGQFVEQKRITKGPIAAISTTTRDKVEVDDETRHLSIRVDESPAQTTRIMEAELEERRGLSAEELQAWHQVQHLLKSRAELPIAFPDWFRTISQSVPNDDVRVRRYFPAFLQACKTVALIRSFKRDEEQLRQQGRIMVKFTDFAIAALIFGPAFAQSLDKASEQEFETQQNVQRISARNDGQPVSATDLARELNISGDRAYSLLRAATDAGTISRANQPTRTNLKLYLPATKGSFLPDPEILFHKLKDASSERVRFIHPITGEWTEYRHKD